VVTIKIIIGINKPKTFPFFLKNTYKKKGNKIREVGLISTAKVKSAGPIMPNGLKTLKNPNNARQNPTPSYCPHPADRYQLKGLAR